MATRDNYIAAYDAAVNYESDPTGALALQFVQAARGILRTPASSVQSQGGLIRFSSEYELKLLREEIVQAQRFIQSCNSKNPSALVQNAKVPRQFGLERMRRDHLPETPPEWAEYNQ